MEECDEEGCPNTAAHEPEEVPRQTRPVVDTEREVLEDEIALLFSTDNVKYTPDKFLLCFVKNIYNGISVYFDNNRDINNRDGITDIPSHKITETYQRVVKHPKTHQNEI